jgi:hypothetical protein
MEGRSENDSDKEKDRKVISDEWVATRGAEMIEGNLLVLLQVNCRSVLSIFLNFWNSVDIYNPDVIIYTELWLREEISND